MSLCHTKKKWLFNYLNIKLVFHLTINQILLESYFRTNFFIFKRTDLQLVSVMFYLCGDEIRRPGRTTRSMVLLFLLTRILTKISKPLNYEGIFRPKSVHIGRESFGLSFILSGKYSEFYSTPMEKSPEVKLLQKRKAGFYHQWIQNSAL